MTSENNEKHTRMDACNREEGHLFPGAANEVESCWDEGKHISDALDECPWSSDRQRGTDCSLRKRTKRSRNSFEKQFLVLSLSSGPEGSEGKNHSAKFPRQLALDSKLSNVEPSLRKRRTFKCSLCNARNDHYAARCPLREDTSLNDSKKRSESSGRSKRQFSCSLCGEKNGHYAAKCPQRPLPQSVDITAPDFSRYSPVCGSRMQSRTKKQFSCGICGMENDHYASRCPERDSESVSNYSSLSYYMKRKLRASGIFPCENTSTSKPNAEVLDAGADTISPQDFSALRNKRSRHFHCSLCGEENDHYAAKCPMKGDLEPNKHFRSLSDEGASEKKNHFITLSICGKENDQSHDSFHPGPTPGELRYPDSSFLPEPSPSQTILLHGHAISTQSLLCGYCGMISDHFTFECLRKDEEQLSASRYEKSSLATHVVRSVENPIQRWENPLFSISSVSPVDDALCLICGSFDDHLTLACPSRDVHSFVNSSNEVTSIFCNDVMDHILVWKAGISVVRSDLLSLDRFLSAIDRVRYERVGNPAMDRILDQEILTCLESGSPLGQSAFTRARQQATLVLNSQGLLSDKAIQVARSVYSCLRGENHEAVCSRDAEMHGVPKAHFLDFCLQVLCGSSGHSTFINVSATSIFEKGQVSGTGSESFACRDSDHDHDLEGAPNIGQETEGTSQPCSQCRWISAVPGGNGLCPSCIEDQRTLHALQP